MSNSLSDIPPYSDSTLNSKGYSLNANPVERFDNSADYVYFNNGAYDSARYSRQELKDIKDKKNSVSKTLQEESKALGGAGPGQDFAGTMAGSYIKITAPKWVCSVICAGLDVDEVFEDAVPKPQSKPSLNSMFDSVSSVSSEEQEVLNVNLNEVNTVA